MKTSPAAKIFLSKHSFIWWFLISAQKPSWHSRSANSLPSSLLYYLSPSQPNPSAGVSPSNLSQSKHTPLWWEELAPTEGGKRISTKQTPVQDLLSGCPSHHKSLHQSPSLTWAAWPQGIWTLRHKPKSFSLERDLSITSYTPIIHGFLHQTNPYLKIKCITVPGIVYRQQWLINNRNNETFPYLMESLKITHYSNTYKLSAVENYMRLEKCTIERQQVMWRGAEWGRV